MKLSLLALLCIPTTAFCQAPGASQVDPDELFQMPGKFAQTVPSFIPPPANMKALTTPLPNDLVLIPGPNTPGPKLNSPQIDPEIIVRPPLPKGGHSPRGQNISRNLYPNLKFLPVHPNPQKHR
jgi:hypothetical protein